MRSSGSGAKRPLVALAGVVLLSLGCTGLIHGPEGVNPGECADDADNDGDGWRDCEDDDCARSDACASEDAVREADEDTGGRDTSVDDSSPSIRIVSPAEGAAVTGCAMVIVELANIELVDFMTESQAVEGQGHYHLLWEDRYLPCTELYCLIGLEREGSNTVEAQLVQNDHNSYLNGAGETIADSVTLDVSAGDCAEGTPSQGY